MDDISAGGFGGEASPTRVGKKVEDFGRRMGFGMLENKVPIGGLLGKEAHVLEAGEGQTEFEKHAAMVVNGLPIVGHVGVVLVPTACRATFLDEGRIGKAFPFGFGQGGVPKRLGLGTAKHKCAETLQFLEIAGVDQLMALEFIWG